MNKINERRCYQLDTKGVTAGITMYGHYSRASVSILIERRAIAGSTGTLSTEPLKRFYNRLKYGVENINELSNIENVYRTIKVLLGTISIDQLVIDFSPAVALQIEKDAISFIHRVMTSFRSRAIKDFPEEFQ